ncbi:MAG: cyclase family protein [Actinobacteria bacterium ATB1]|nr:cyclase family protein [Actinobacteria bacterium ATB1]
MALPEHLRELAAKVSNWGRWGEKDQRGTVNLIDAEAERRGAEAVRSGRSVSLSLPFDQNGPQTGAVPGRVNPLRSLVSLNSTYTGDSGDGCWTDDVVTLATQSVTHWDALAHCSYDGFIYNGFPAGTITADTGARKCGIDQVGPVVTRGVLLDLPMALGVDRLEPGYAITPEDLDAAVEHAGVDVRSGDALLVRTGQLAVLRAAKTVDEKNDYRFPAPGLSTLTIGWFRDRDVAAVATDNYTFEVYPCEESALQGRPSWTPVMPVHCIHLRDMGLLQGQNWDLDALAADCADDGRYSFLLSATPIRFTGSLGGPVHPVATK